MAKKKKTAVVEYELLTIKLSGYKASVDASINHNDDEGVYARLAKFSHSR